MNFLTHAILVTEFPRTTDDGLLTWHSLTKIHQYLVIWATPITCLRYSGWEMDQVMIARPAVRDQPNVPPTRLSVVWVFLKDAHVPLLAAQSISLAAVIVKIASVSFLEHQDLIAVDIHLVVTDIN